VVQHDNGSSLDIVVILTALAEHGTDGHLTTSTSHTTSYPVAMTRIAVDGNTPGWTDVVPSLQLA
jgi:hypothetical protein